VERWLRNKVLAAVGAHARRADRMGLLRSAIIQKEHSAGAAGLFEMRRAEGAERHSTELKDLFRGRSSDQVPLICWTSQPILKLAARQTREKEIQDEHNTGTMANKEIKWKYPDDGLKRHQMENPDGGSQRHQRENPDDGTLTKTSHGKSRWWHIKTSNGKFRGWHIKTSHGNSR
jgi:hypothetical protein